MRHIFIFNPAAGRKSSLQDVRYVIEASTWEQGLKPEIVATEAPGHATRLAEEFAAAGEPVRLYAVGGDGTLNEVFAGAWRHPNAEVACVPFGSGNDFIRSFGTKEDFNNIGAVAAGRAVTIDLMGVDSTTEAGRSGISAAITSTGLDAEVAYNIPKYRRVPLLGGSMAYNLSILEKLLKPLGKQLRVNIDGKSFEDKYLIAAVCNGRHYGGGYNAAPMASLSDGILDIILVKKISRLLIASIISKYKKGLHIQDGQVVPELRDVMEYHTGREVEIVPTGTEPFILNVDGECAPAPHLFARVMPAAARFVLPQKLADEYEAQ